MEELNLVIGYPSSDFRVKVENFAIEEGKIISILGTNGTGKSTFYRTLMGEIPPVEGNVPAKLTEEIAIVSDRVNVPDDCSVKSVLGLLDSSSLEKVRATYPAICLFVLKQSSKRINSLSSGQKRVVQIFLMLASGKRVIIMDEACAYLDLKNKQLVFDALRDIAKSGASVLYTSHEMEDLNAFHSDVYMFNEGVLSRYTGEISQDSLKKDLLQSGAWE